MGKHVYAAIDRDVHTIHTLRMYEDRHAVPMRLLNRGLGSGQGQDCNFPPTLIGTSKQFDSIRAFGGVIAHQSNRLVWGCGVCDVDMVFLEKITNIHRFNRPNGLADCENAWAA